MKTRGFTIGLQTVLLMGLTRYVTSDSTVFPTSSVSAKGTQVQTTAPPTQKPTTSIDYCNVDPYKVCHLTGPVECFNNGGNYSCSCSKGYYNKSSSCVVGSSISGSLYFANVTSSNITVQDIINNVTKTFNSINSAVASYIQCIVTPSVKTKSGYQMDADTSPVGPLTLVTEIIVNGLIASDESQIDTNINNYIIKCGHDCFLTGSNVNYTETQSAGPCNTTANLCSAFPNTICLPGNSTTTQFRCGCSNGITATSTYIANGGQISVCPSPKHCTTNPCQHSGVCNELSDGSGYSCKCPWTYQGLQCDNPLPMAMVIVACILCVLLVASLFGLICSFKKNNKSSWLYEISSDERRVKAGGPEPRIPKEMIEIHPEPCENVNFDLPQPNVEY